MCFLVFKSNVAISNQIVQARMHACTDNKDIYGSDNSCQWQKHTNVTVNHLLSDKRNNNELICPCSAVILLLFPLYDDKHLHRTVSEGLIEKREVGGKRVYNYTLTLRGRRRYQIFESQRNNREKEITQRGVVYIFGRDSFSSDVFYVNSKTFVLACDLSSCSNGGGWSYDTSHIQLWMHGIQAEMHIVSSTIQVLSWDVLKKKVLPESVNLSWYSSSYPCGHSPHICPLRWPWCKLSPLFSHFGPAFAAVGFNGSFVSIVWSCN